MENYIILSISFSILLINLIECKLISKIREETRALLNDDERNNFDRYHENFHLINELERKVLGLETFDYPTNRNKLKHRINKRSIKSKKDKKLNQYEIKDIDFVMDNPMFNPSFFQGDILLTHGQIKKIIDDLHEQIEDIKNKVTKTHIKTTTMKIEVTDKDEDKDKTTTIKEFTIKPSKKGLDEDDDEDENKTTTVKEFTIKPNKKELGEDEDEDKKTTVKEFTMKPNKKRLNEDDDEDEDEDDDIEPDEDSNNNKRKKRDSPTVDNHKWELPIPYYINDTLNSINIDAAINLFHQNTCIRFTKQENYIEKGEGINFYPGPGCWSFLGLHKKNKSQQISLGDDCDSNVNIIQHQIAHALGLPHQESFYKRDYDNSIDTTKLIKNLEGNLAITNYSQIISIQTDYDFGSSMHFNDSKIGKTNESIILPNTIQYNRMKTNNKTLNFNDYKTLNNYYCSEKCSNQFGICKNNGYQDPNNCYKCKCPKGFDGQYCHRLKQSIGICGRKNLIARNVRQAVIGRGYSDCYYMITGVKSSKIKLLLTESFNGAQEPCLENTGLEIKYRKNKGITGLCLCGIHRNISLISDDNIVLIKYFGKKLADYFRLEYTAVF